MAPSAIYLHEEKSDLSTEQPITSIQPTITAADDNGSNTLIEQALRTRISAIDADTCDAGGEDAFFVADLGDIHRQHQRWKLNLPRVEPHYGIYTLYKSFFARILTGRSCEMQSGLSGHPASLWPGYWLRLRLQERDRAGNLLWC